MISFRSWNAQLNILYLKLIIFIVRMKETRLLNPILEFIFNSVMTSWSQLIILFQKCNPRYLQNISSRIGFLKRNGTQNINYRLTQDYRWINYCSLDTKNGDVTIYIVSSSYAFTVSRNLLPRSKVIVNVNFWNRKFA